MGQSIREIDPKELRLPPSRTSGADPWKLHQQIRQFGSSRDEMPPIFVNEDPDVVFEIFDGVTRATRIAKLAPGETVPNRRDRALPPEPSQFPMREGSDVSESETRAELFAAIQSLAVIVPEMRAGQLVAALGELCADLHGRGLWDASDTELFEAVGQFRRDFEAAMATQSRRET